MRKTMKNELDRLGKLPVKLLKLSVHFVFMYLYF